MNFTEPFWWWWMLTIVVAGCQIVRSWQRPEELLGFATVASVLWLYIYAYLPYHLISEEKHAFPPAIWNFAQSTAFFSLLSLLAGWHLRCGTFRQVPQKNAALPSFDLRRVWWMGLGAMFVGLIGFYSFTRSESTYEEASAYWYLLFHTCYPGMALCVAVFVLSPRHRSIMNLLFVAMLAGAIILPLLLNARRGPTFVAIIAVFFSFASVRRKTIHPVVVLSVLCAAGLLLLLLVTSRRVTYSEGGTWTEFLQTVRIEEFLEERAEKSSDNEYFNHCQMIEANLETGLYQYGTAHLAVFLNWIPRQFWPDKPQRSLGLFPEASYQVVSHQGSNLGLGGAWGAVADSFNNYWYFFPLFWIAIGWSTAAAYMRGRVFDSLRWKMCNVGILCASHWFIAQTFSEAFVPFMIYQGVFFCAFRLSRVRVDTDDTKLATRVGRTRLPVTAQ